jgi:hypothetical protein
MSSKLAMAMEPENVATAATELQPEAECIDAESLLATAIETDRLESDSLQALTWVMASKPVGSLVAGWQIIERFEDKTRTLAKSERCQVTSFCYPIGAKLVEATVAKEVDEQA